MSRRRDKRRLWRVRPRRVWPYGWCLYCGRLFYDRLSRVWWDQASGEMTQMTRRPRGAFSLAIEIPTPFILGPFLSELDQERAIPRRWLRLTNLDVHYLRCRTLWPRS